MGDIADDMYDIALVQSAKNHNIYDNSSDKELKEAVIFYMEQECYEPDDFTNMVKNILKNDNFSKKQRKVLIGHLYYHGDID